MKKYVVLKLNKYSHRNKNTGKKCIYKVITIIKTLRNAIGMINILQGIWNSLMQINPSFLIALFVSGAVLCIVLLVIIRNK